MKRRVNVALQVAAVTISPPNFIQAKEEENSAAKEKNAEPKVIVMEAPTAKV